MSSSIDELRQAPSNDNLLSKNLLEMLVEQGKGLAEQLSEQHKNQSEMLVEQVKGLAEQHKELLAALRENSSANAHPSDSNAAVLHYDARVTVLVDQSREQSKALRMIEDQSIEACVISRRVQTACDESKGHASSLDKNVAKIGNMVSQICDKVSHLDNNVPGQESTTEGARQWSFTEGLLIGVAIVTILAGVVCSIISFSGWYVSRALYYEASEHFG